MIGWAPVLLTFMALALLVIVVVDASAGFGLTGSLKGHAVATALHNAVNAAIQWLSHFGVQDWVLVGLAIYLLAWGWVRAFAFVRLGTIQIADLSCDDDKLAPAGAKAVLQQALGGHGLLPPSGVPSGSPTVASIADVISNAAIPQAKWLGSLVGLIPWPPVATGFQISGNLRRTGDGETAPVCFAYEVICIGPQRSRSLGKAQGADAPEAITAASPDIYRTIAEGAPRLYPPWARWHSSEALVTYLEGIEIERDKRYEDAHERYMAACAADPDNMIARLRAANCLERMATGAVDPDRRRQLQVEALAAYTSIRIRRDTIFEAVFRESVLLSVLASEATEDLQRDPLLQATIARVERAIWDTLDPRSARLTTLTRSMRMRFKHRVRRRLVRSVNGRLETAALEEARRARHQLRPFRTLCHEYRLRGRFEPTGRERRQLRKALGISKMAQKARSEHRRGGGRRDEPSPLRHAASLARQFRWQMIVKWHYLACRWHVAGWTAHYNAACFYSLLPRAEKETGLRRRALKHLGFALDQADGALDCAYVRDEDPDLATLRQLCRAQLTEVLGRVCQDELVVQYEAPGIGSTWRLRASGAAVSAGNDGYAWFDPVEVADGMATFRVRIFDENRCLRFEARCNGEAAAGDPGYELIPATLTGQTITVHPATGTVDVEGQLTVTTAWGAAAGESGDRAVVQALSVNSSPTT